MSVQDEPVPPVPEHTPPKKEDEGTPNAGKYFSHTWTRWFVSLREKVNVINDTVASLSQLVGNGFVTVDGGTTVSRSIVGTDDRVSVANGNGVAGNPTIDVVTADLIAGPNVSFTGSGAGRIIDNGDGPLTISATGGGGGASWTVISTWDHSVDGDTLHFIVPVGSYKEIMIYCRAVTAASSAWRCVTLSSDGGTTWDTSSHSVAPSGTLSSPESCMVLHSSNTSSARYGFIQFPLTTPEIWAIAPVRNTSSSISGAQYVTGISDPITHIRVSATTNNISLAFVNMTGGVITVWGR